MAISMNERQETHIELKRSNDFELVQVYMYYNRVHNKNRI